MKCPMCEKISEEKVCPECGYLLEAPVAEEPIERSEEGHPVLRATVGKLPKNQRVAVEK